MPNNETTIKQMSEALKANPKDSNAFKTLESEYQQTRQWKKICEIYQIRLDAVKNDDPTEAARLMFRMAEIQEKELGEKDAARENYIQASVLQPRQKSYSDALIRLYTNEANWSKVLEMLQRQWDASSKNEEKIAVLLAMSQVYDRLQKKAECKKCLGQILEMDSRHTEACQKLEKLYSEDQQWPELMNLLQIQLNNSTDFIKKIHYLERMALLARDQHNFNQAILFYQQILALSPDHWATLHQLESLYQQLNRWVDVIAVLQQQLKLLAKNEEKAQLLVRIAQIWEEKIADTTKAAEAYEQAATVCESDAILSALEKLYFNGSHWDKLASVYERQSKRSNDVNLQADLGCRIGALAKDKLKDLERAVTWYQIAYQKRGKNLELLKILQELYQERRDVPKLIDSYYQEIALVKTDAEKIALYHKIADLYRTQKDLKAVACVYEEVLQKYPNQMQALENLKSVYIKLQDYPALIKIYQMEIKMLAGKVESIPAYLASAEILQNKLNDEPHAVQCYQEVVKLDAARLEIWQKLYTYYRKTANHAAMIGALENIIRCDAKLTEDARLEIATLYRDNIKDTEKAILNFRAVLNVNTDQLIAIKALTDLYKTQTQWSLYLEMIQKQLELSLDSQNSIQLHWAAIEVYRPLQKWEAFEEHLLAILKLQFNHRQALDELEKFYKDQEDWAKYVEVLKKKLSLFSWSVPELFQQHHEIASLYVHQLQDIASAIYHYEKALSFDPNHVETLEELARLYQEQKDAANQVRILEKLAALATTNETQRDYLMQVANVQLNELHDEQAAIAALERVVTYDRNFIAAWDQLEQLYQKQNDAKQLARVYVERSHISEENTEKIAFAIQAAQLYEQLQQPNDAIFQYEAVLQINARHVIALRQLLVLDREQERWNALSDVYQKQIAITEEQAEIIRLKFELADLLRGQLQNHANAVTVYREILELNPDEIEAIYALQQIYTENNQFAEMEETLQLEENTTTNIDHKKDLRIQMGQLCEEKLADYPKAITHYNVVLNLDPQHLETIRTLRRLYYKLQDFENVVAMLDAELGVIAQNEETSETKTTQIALLVEKADVAKQRLCNLPLAVAALEQILTLDVENIPAYQGLLELHLQQNHYQEAVAILGLYIKVADPEQKKELWTKAAHIQIDHLKQDDEGKAALYEAIGIDVQYAPARTALEILHRRLQEWSELIALYQQEIEFTKDDDRRAELYYQMGQIWEQNLGNQESALLCYHQVLEIHKNDLSTIKNLQRIEYEQEKYPELLDAYQRELLVDVAEPECIEKERKIWLLLTCAELQRHQLHDIDGAIESYQTVLNFQLDPNNLIAIRGLQEMYDEREMYKDLQAMLFKELELQKDTKRLIMVHLHLACLMEEKLRTPDVAIEHFSEAHLSRPQNLPILQRLKNLLANSRRWASYAEMVEKEILLCTRNPDLLPLHKDLLVVYDQELNQLDMAIQHGEKVLLITPEDMEVIHRLQSLYQRKNDFEKLAAMYQREVALQTGNTLRLVFLHLESGKLYWEKLKKLEVANECFMKVLQLEPVNTEAITALIAIRTELKSWEDLIHIHEYAAKISQDQIEIITHYLRVAELWDREFQNDSKALLSYQIVYSMDNKNYVAVNGMRKIFERQKRWGDAIEFLNVEVQLITEEKKRPPLYLRMGEYWEEKLNMPHQALTCYLKVMGHGFHRATAERIMRIQEQVGDYQGLVEIIERDIKVTDKPEDLVPKILKLARIQWKNLNYLDAAVETYSRILKLDKKQMESLNALIELFTIQKKWKKLVQILNLKREAVTEAQELVQVYTQLGEIFDAQLHSGNQAIRHYEQALELAPHNLDLIHTLQRLYREWGYYKKLIPLYNKEILLISDRNRILNLYSQIGECWELRLFEDEQSIRAYEKLLELDNEQLHAVRALARLYKRNQSWDKMVVVYGRLINEALKNQDYPEAIQFLLDLGIIYRDETNQPEAAISAFSKVVELQPAHGQALQALELLYKSLGKSQEMAVLLRQKLSCCHEDEERLELYIHLGKLYEQELDDQDQAIEAFINAINLDPHRLDVLKSLDGLYRKKKKWDELAATCIKEIALSHDPAEKAELSYQLGLIKRDRFHLPEDAKQLFLQAVEYQPTMRKALKALTGLAIMVEDWTQAVKYITQEISYIQEPNEKVEALTDLGLLYQNKLKLIQKAKEIFQQSLDIDPQSIIAIEAMANIHYAQKEAQQAETLFGRLVLLVDKTKAEQLSSIYYKWAQVAENLNKKDEAVIRYTTALDIKPDNLDALLALGSLYFDRAQWGFDKSQWQEALNIYQKIFQHPKLEEGKIDVIRKLAKIYGRLGQSDKAIEYYQKILAAIPEESESTQALAKLHIERNEDEAALKYLYTTVRSETSSFQDRRTALMTIADAQARLNHYKESVEARIKALGMGVEDPVILKQIGEGFIALKDWNKAYEYLDKHYRCLDENEVTEKIENRCLMAKVVEEGQASPQRALQIYQDVLALDPTWIPAIRGISSIYEHESQWELMAAAYQNFLSKLPEGQNQVGLPIHLELGNLYLEKLKDYKAAIRQFSKALELDPTHLGCRTALANIKALDPSLQDEAIQEHLFLLRRDPVRISSYRGLYKLYTGKNQPDLSIRSLRALALLTNLTDTEQKALAATAPKKIQHIAYDTLISGLWANQRHPYREMIHLNNDLFNRVYPAELEKEYGVTKKKDNITAKTASATPIAHTVFQIVEEIRAMLEIGPVDIYLLPKKSAKIVVENTSPASLICSGPLLEALNENEIRFLVAKHLFYVSQNQIAAHKLKFKGIQQHFKLLKEIIAGETSQHTPDEDAISKAIQAAFRPIPIIGLPKLKKDLTERTDLWEQIGKEDLALYLKQLDFAANHFALIASDSLALTVEMVYRFTVLQQTEKLVKVERIASQDLIKIEAIQDILLYNLSDEYSDLRKKTGQFITA